MQGLLSAVALLVMVAPQAAGQDKVNLKNAETKQGQIQDWDFRGVKLALSSGGGSTTIKQSDIVTVDYGAQPKEFQEAQSEFARNRYEEAVVSYTAVIDNKKNRGVFRQDAAMNRSLSQLALGKVEDAVTGFKGLLTEFPESKHIDAAQSRIVDALVATGKAADAVTFVEAEESRLAKVSESGPLLERLKMLKARAYLGANDTKKAKTEAAAIAGGSSPMAGAAKVMLGEIALAEKNVAEARKWFNDALKTVTERRDRGAAFNGLGTILLEEGKANRSPDPIREALLLFLRTALVQVPEAGEPTDAHETGIYRAAECFQYLGELGAGGAAKTDTKGGGASAAPSGGDDAQARNLGRARDLFRRLLREYPQSRYAADAQTRLQKLGG